jgi:hypothetical protein
MSGSVASLWSHAPTPMPGCRHVSVWHLAAGLYKKASPSLDCLLRCSRMSDDCQICIDLSESWWITWKIGGALKFKIQPTLSNSAWETNNFGASPFLEHAPHVEIHLGGVPRLWWTAPKERKPLGPQVWDIPKLYISIKTYHKHQFSSEEEKQWNNPRRPQDLSLTCEPLPFSRPRLVVLSFHNLGRPSGWYILRYAKQLKDPS